MTKQIAALALSLVALPAAAQTTDAFWRAWNSREEVLAPRATALGGADVALTDDASAAPRNPVLLARLWRHEAAASFGGPGRADFTHVGLARWSAQGFAAGVFARRTSSLVVRTADSRLDAELTETGVQVTRRIGRGLAVGVGLEATRLTLAGESARMDGARLRAGAGAASTRVGASFGAVWEDSRWTAAAALRTGTTFEATRTATGDGRWDDPSTAVGVRHPWRASLGAAMRPSLRVSLQAQADVRGAGSLRRAARAIAAAPVIEAERGGVDALRAAAQYALPLERVSLIARVGVARLTEAGLRTASAVGAPLAGSAPARTRLTAGAGVAFENTTLDLAYDGAGRWSVEIRLRWV